MKLWMKAFALLLLLALLLTASCAQEHAGGVRLERINDEFTVLSQSGIQIMIAIVDTNTTSLLVFQEGKDVLSATFSKKAIEIQSITRQGDNTAIVFDSNGDGIPEKRITTGSDGNSTFMEVFEPGEFVPIGPGDRGQAVISD